MSGLKKHAEWLPEDGQTVNINSILLNRSVSEYTLLFVNVKKIINENFIQKNLI
jgi:hypothetical protein